MLAPRRMSNAVKRGCRATRERGRMIWLCDRRSARAAVGWIRRLRHLARAGGCVVIDLYCVRASVLPSYKWATHSRSARMKSDYGIEFTAALAIVNSRSWNLKRISELFFRYSWASLAGAITSGNPHSFRSGYHPCSPVELDSLNCSSQSHLPNACVGNADNLGSFPCCNAVSSCRYCCHSHNLSVTLQPMQ